MKSTTPVIKLKPLTRKRAAESRYSLAFFRWLCIIQGMLRPAPFQSLPTLLALILAALSPLVSHAQLVDVFTTDTSLNTNRWTTSSGLLMGLANEFNSALIIPILSFDASGMNMSGVNSVNELAGIQSRAFFQPPFTLTTSVTASQAHGNAYELFLVSADWVQWINVAGNLNPGNGSFFGVWVNYANSGLPFLSLGNNLYSDPRINSQYTVQMFVDHNGMATVSLTSSSGAPMGLQSNLSLGSGPFYLILGQREGGPRVAGPNVATWKNVSMIPSAPAPVLAPITWTGGTLTLAWTAVPGATYQAQYSSTLAPAQWNNLGAPLVATASLATTTDSPAPDVKRFYRVVLMP